MHPIQLKTISTTSYHTGASLLRAFTAAKALLPAPAPDGGYPGGNTAEGINALHDVNTAVGINNTAVGANSSFITILPVIVTWRLVRLHLPTTPLVTLTWPSGRRRSDTTTPTLTWPLVFGCFKSRPAPITPVLALERSGPTTPPVTNTASGVPLRC